MRQMAILAECPICHNKQATKNKVCKCGQNMDSAKRSKRVRYWIVYYLASGKQRREICDKDKPYSIEVAQAAHGKRVAQKYENPSILEKVPEETMTFEELAKWYLGLKTIKKLHTFNRVNGCLSNFNKTYGNRIVGSIKAADLEDYQSERAEQNRTPATIDMELTWVKAMINKAFDNDMVSGNTLKAFRGYKRKLKKGSNARKRILSFKEYLALTERAAEHLKPILTVAFYTGMRLGELRTLTWSYVDLKNRMIRLPEKSTKEGKAKNIPINEHVAKVLLSLPRALHHAFVFTYRSEPITAKEGFKTSFKTACKNADIPHGRKTPDGITFHDIRRTVKTNMVNAGVDKTHRDIILGHSLKGMDVHYVVASEDDLHRAMAKYTEWVDAQLSIIDQNIDQVDRSAVCESAKV